MPRPLGVLGAVVGLALAVLGPGCRATPPILSVPVTPQPVPVAEANLPKELNKVTLPPYVVESPDVLSIEAQRLVPLAPLRVEPLDVLHLFAPNAPERDPINALYPVAPDGTINLGDAYGGRVQVADRSLAEVEAAVTRHLAKYLKKPAVTVTLAQSHAVRELRGERPVRSDGTVSLGSFGSVYVAGLTVPQVKEAIERHLAQTFERPQVAVDVTASNSKFYYVVTIAGGGERVARFPATGNETVLDAIALIGGLPPAATGQIWIARPAPSGSRDQILPVDWHAISRRGSTGTNYQLLPGDRLFVAAHH